MSVDAETDADAEAADVDARAYVVGVHRAGAQERQCEHGCKQDFHVSSISLFSIIETINCQGGRPLKFARYGFPLGSDSPHEQENDDHDQDDPDDTDPAVAIPVTVAAETAAEPAEQEDDKDDDEYESQ